MVRSVTGTVTSNAMNKTIVVTVHAYKTHPKYHKKYRVSHKFYAHDENNSCKVGDTVTIFERRPMSKLKRWTITAPSASVTK